MTVMFNQFFGVPQQLIRKGIWAKMRPSEKDLYICLMERSERYRTRLVRITDTEVREASGAAPRSLCNARKRLQEIGLVKYTKNVGNRFEYLLCDPDTGKPYPRTLRRTKSLM